MSADTASWAGAHESELESEFEMEYEGEAEGEEFLGGLGNVLGGLLGEGEASAESESEFEFEDELEGEYEGEQFFGGLFKKLGPILKKVAKVAAPMVGTAILGPGAGTALGNVVSSALGEAELEGEFESEFEMESEDESEFEGEGESEAASEIANHPMTEYEAMAEYMAEAASHAGGQGEAEAMAGAAMVTVLAPRDRRALRRLLPHLVRGARVLTRILHRHRTTRPIVRAVPTIMRRSVRQLKRRAAAGKPITRRMAARTTAREVRRVLGSRKLVGTALKRNLRSSRAVKRTRSYRGFRPVSG